MTRVDMAAQEAHLRLLQAELLGAGEDERAAYVIFGLSRIEADPFDKAPRLRVLVHEILAVEPDEIISADHRHISWRTERFVRLLAEAERDGRYVGIAHSHPAGPFAFSAQDDQNESDLATLARNRKGEDAPLLSLLMTADGALMGRLWTSPQRNLPVEVIRTVSANWKFYRQGSAPQPNEKAMNRQGLALGEAFNQTMRALRIGVVGAGGTGSPLIQQLARMGAGHLAIFDPDHIEETNLNRVYGATREDADEGALKVDVARREVERMGLGTRVVTVSAWIGSPECRDILKSMDVIFGCTDDHEGRILLNRFAYYYLVPVVDIGLALRVAERHGEKVLDGDGRVTVLEPGASCLLCRNIVDPAAAAEEALRRADPAEYERRKLEAYVRGEGNPAPAVVSFTTSVATMAIEELIQRLQQFRGATGAIANRVRKFGLVEDFRPGAAKRPCRVCGAPRIFGAGDVSPFLGRAG